MKKNRQLAMLLCGILCMSTIASCGGSGAEKGTSAQTCRKCGGRGSITVQKRTPFGMMQSSAVCDECGGKGKIIQTPCRDCRGSGVVRKSKTLEVNIPAGIDHGQRISLGGQGDCGANGGPNGDLLIQVNVRKHELFMREGYDIYYELPITFADATLGAKITVPTPDGEGELNIPEGTQTGTTFTVRGKGVPRGAFGAGACGIGLLRRRRKGQFNNYRLDGNMRYASSDAVYLGTTRALFL